MTVRVLEGHVLDVLRSLPSSTFQCVATSPPYYGLRDYGLPPQVWGGEPEHEHEWEPLPPRTPWVARPDHNNGVFTGTRGVHASSAEVSKERAAGAFCACGAWLGSLGLEPTPELYVEHLVSVFREVRRVLRPDGCIFVNLGDSYAGSGRGPTGHNGIGDQAERQGFTGGGCVSWADRSLLPSGVGVTPTNCKPKDLLGMPWMAAFALRADGWYLRAEIIWSKPNPMPESVTDRPTKAHETVFLLAKSRTYFYDAEAIREEAQYGYRDQPSGDARPWAHLDNRAGSRTVSGAHPEAGRNKRSVWEIATAPFPSAHFATFPPKLVEPMLLAGTSEKGCCPECGKPWGRVTSAKYVRDPAHGGVVGRHYETGANGWDGSGMPRLNKEVTTTGWRATCTHDAAPVPCQVLDPFGGAGTTGLVADRLGRDCTLIELNPEYAQMARDRITGDSPLFAEVVA